MIRAKIIFYIVLSTVLSIYGFSAQEHSLGVVLDGPAPILKDTLNKTLEEISSLEKSDFKVNVEYGEYNPNIIYQKITAFINNPEIQCILVLGPLSADVVSTMDNRGRIIVGGVFNPDFKGAASIMNSLNAQSGVIVVPEYYMDLYSYEISSLPDSTLLNVVAVDRTGTVDLVEDTNVVWFLDSGSLDINVAETLVKHLSDHSRPFFSMDIVRDWSGYAVLDSSDSHLAEKEARRLGLILSGFQKGKSVNELKNVSVMHPQFTVNESKMKTTGTELPFSILDNAYVLKTEDSDNCLNLKSAVRESIENNLDIVIASHEKEKGKAYVTEAKSLFLPTVDVSVTGVKLDKSSTAAALNISENSINGDVTVTQLIYSEDANTNFSIQSSLQRARELKLESEIRDTILNTCNVYIDVLRTKALCRVEKENVEVTRKNMELALLRTETGVSAPTDKYRWKSMLTARKTALLEAEAMAAAAQVEFNRVLNRPLDSSCELEDLHSEDPFSLINIEFLKPYFESPVRLDLLAEFLESEINKTSPELQAYNELVDASERELTAAKRNNYLPVVAFQGTYSDKFSKWGAGSETLILPPEFGSLLPEMKDSSWNMGVSLKFSPFTGGAKRARKMRATEGLYQKKAERLQLENRLQAGLKKLMAVTVSSYRSIELAKQSKDAGEKNLELFQDAYKNGLISVTELLEAQNAAFKAKEYYHNAVYTFVANFLAVDRLSSSFVSFMEDSERFQWEQGLNNYINKHNERSN